MTTTIQISEELKDILISYKNKSNQTYEDVIRDLINEKEKANKKNILLLKEGYETMYGLDKKIVKDFEKLDLDGLNKDDY